MINFRKLGLLSLFLFSITFNGMAQDLKIGYVNPQAILERMPELKAVQQKIANFAERIGAPLEQEGLALQQEYNNLNAKASAMAPAALEKEAQALREKEFALQEKARKAESDIQQRRNELLAPLFQNINTAISSVAQENGYAYILNTTTTSGDRIILYASQAFQMEHDITEKVMAKLDM